MTTPNLKNSMKKFNLKNDAIIESELQGVLNCQICPRDSKLITEEGYIIIDNGSMGGCQWTSLVLEDKKSVYADSFVGAPDEFLADHLSNPLIYQN